MLDKINIIKKILYNFGIKDIDIIRKISDQISDEELKSFLLVFPIDKRDFLSMKDISKDKSVNGIYSSTLKVIRVISIETGLQINEKNKELISLSMKDYDDYFNKIKEFFYKRNYYDDKKIIELINLIPVKYFELFLIYFDETRTKKVSCLSMSKEIGVSEPFLNKWFAKIKLLIKDQTGIEILSQSEEKSKIELTDEEKYIEDAMKYFNSFWIVDYEKLSELLSLVNQKDIRIFMAVYPFKKREMKSQLKVAESLNIPLITLKRSLQKVYDAMVSLRLPFFENYYRIIKYQDLDKLLLTEPNTEKERISAITTIYGSDQITEIVRSMNKIDPRKKAMLLAIRPLDGKEGISIKKYAEIEELSVDEVFDDMKKTIREVRDDILRAKTILSEKDKESIFEIINFFGDSTKKQILILLFGLNKENRRYSIKEISNMLSLDEENIRDVLIEFILLKSDIANIKSKNKK